MTGGGGGRRPEVGKSSPDRSLTAGGVHRRPGRCRKTPVYWWVGKWGFGDTPVEDVGDPSLPPKERSARPGIWSGLRTSLSSFRGHFGGRARRGSRFSEGPCTSGSTHLGPWSSPSALSTVGGRSTRTYPRLPWETHPALVRRPLTPSVRVLAPQSREKYI